MKRYHINLALSEEVLTELIGAIRNQIDLLESGPENDALETGKMIDELIQLDMQLTTDKELADGIDRGQATMG